MDCGYIQIGLKNNCASEKDLIRIDVGCQRLKIITGSLTAACNKNVNPVAFKISYRTLDDIHKLLVKVKKGTEGLTESHRYKRFITLGTPFNFALWCQEGPEKKCISSLNRINEIW